MQTRLLYLVFFLLITGCTPVYIPNSRNLPSVNDVNEAQFTGMAGTNGFDINALYNIHDNIGIMANGSFAKNTRSENNSIGPAYHKHLFGEAGVGYYKSLRRSRSTIAFYSGLGWGNSFSEDINRLDDSVFQKGTFRRYFLQPSIVFDIDFINLGLAGRFSNINFTKYETHAGFQNQPINEWFLEFVVELSAEVKDFDLLLQAGTNTPMNKEDVIFKYRILHASVGLRYNLTRGKELK